jgi:hypothetical protein
MSLTLNELKKLTEKVGEDVLTKEVFERYFTSDFSNEGAKSTYRYTLKLNEPLAGEPEEIRNASLENRLFTNDDKKKSGPVKQIGVVGKELFNRLMILTVKNQVSNFYVTSCNDKTTASKKVVTVVDYFGAVPTKAGLLCVDHPNFATCLNIKDAEEFQVEPHTEAFLRAFFSMMKKYIENS